MRRVRGILPLLLGALAAAAHAQSRAAGRVVRVAGRDTVAVGDLAVVLHRVGSRTQGPIDTARSDPAGRFQFRFAADTAAAYLLSARYAGIEYFSSPIATNPARPDTAVVVVVADTSSTTPVLVRQRTLLIAAPDESGTRTVLDWFVLHNPGTATRVAPDPVRPSWGTPLPAEAQNVELADNRLSQFSPDAMMYRGDSALVLAPLSPGEKELMLQYRIPGTLKLFSVPAGPVSDSVFVMMEERGSTVRTPGFVAADSQSLEGRWFRRWSGRIEASGTLQIGLPSALLSSQQILGVLVAGFGAGFAVIAILVRRRLRTRRTRQPTADPSYWVDLIAQLDARYQGREATTPAPEWAGYLEERARLKALLQQALAPGVGRS